VLIGAQAGGFEFSSLIGIALPARCASSSGSSWPFGSPGYVGWTNSNVAGCPSIVIELTVMSEPGALSLDVLLCASKSRLKSVRHCVERCVSSTWLPGRKRLSTAS
jgi:hypothetical protein